MTANWNHRPNPTGLLTTHMIAFASLASGVSSPQQATSSWFEEHRIEVGFETATETFMTAATAETLCVDTERSVVHWLGTKIGGQHEGTVRLAEGYLSRHDTGITGGAFTVDMRSIDVTDIPPHEVQARRNLLSHLAHEEFFGVERFPTAGFVITDLTGGDGDVYTVSGNLGIRDSLHNVTFDAAALVVTNEQVRATAAFSIDRRRWGVEFDGLTSLLRNAIVHNEIQFTIRLVATAEACNIR